MFGAHCSLFGVVCSLCIVRRLMCAVCLLCDVCWPLLFIACCALRSDVCLLFVLGCGLFAGSHTLLVVRWLWLLFGVVCLPCVWLALFLFVA